MIVFPVPDSYIPKFVPCGCCVLLVDALLIALVALYIVALDVDSDAKDFVCATSTEASYLWDLSLASAVGRVFVTLRILFMGRLGQDRKKKIENICEITYCIGFAAETLPGLLIFHLLLTCPEECMDDFMYEYDILGNVVTIQGYASLFLIVLATLGCSYSFLVYALGPSGTSEQNKEERAKLTANAGGIHKSGHGYVLRNNKVCV